MFFYQFCAEIIAISSDNSEATMDVEPLTWEDYFPKDYNPNDYFVTSKKVETSTNMTNKHEAKMAFDARVKVLGLPNEKTCEDIGIKSFVIKNPKDPKGKGKKRWFKSMFHVLMLLVTSYVYMFLV